LRGRFVGFALALAAAGCATTPMPVMPAEDDYYDPEPYPALLSSPLVESPPIEPAEPAPPVPDPPASTLPSNPVVQLPAPRPAPPSAEVATNSQPASEPSEDQQLLSLLADLQRYGSLQNDDLKRELASATQALSRQRSDANRVRLAVLYTLLRTSPQDDQRAAQLFDNVAKSGPVASPVRQLAAVLHAQLTERQRAVRDEQQKADAAIQKLEALRAMERSLLRDRVRSGGGGGGGAGGSGR